MELVQRGSWKTPHSLPHHSVNWPLLRTNWVLFNTNKKDEKNCIQSMHSCALPCEINSWNSPVWFHLVHNTSSWCLLENRCKIKRHTSVASFVSVPRMSPRPHTCKASAPSLSDSRSHECIFFIKNLTEKFLNQIFQGVGRVLWTIFVLTNTSGKGRESVTYSDNFT